MAAGMLVRNRTAFVVVVVIVIVIMIVMRITVMSVARNTVRRALVHRAVKRTMNHARPQPRENAEHQEKAG